MNLELPTSWADALGDESHKPYYRSLTELVAADRARHVVFPPEPEVFTALVRTPFAEVRVVILGQDPYHGEGQAHGLAFSVRPGVKTPPSLANMFKELASDVGVSVPSHGCLLPWADQGVLLLNTSLTVRAQQAGSHQKFGWETFTDAVVARVSEAKEGVVFVLWGAPARRKAKLIDTSKHTVLEGAHPSPLSAHKGFFGSKPFSRINAALVARGLAPIDWRLPQSP